MKLGVFAVLLSDKSLEDTLSYLVKSGVQAVEIGTGGYPGNAHCDPVKLLSDSSVLDKFKKTIADSGLTISALSCHGNPVHPNKEIAKSYQDIFINTILLAEKLGVNRVVTFSGCPGDCTESKYPNWVTCPWPEDFLKVLDYQWNDVLIPYWKEASAFAKAHGVTKICLEMHPGFAVYNPESLLKLRTAVGDCIGANFDPSHLFWQGIDPVLAIRNLGNAIFHFHAKDSRIDSYNCAANGVLDTKHYGNIADRGWVFRTVGYGHGYDVWKDMMSALKIVGYDDVISIEHEDGLMSANEGLQKAIAFLKEVMVFENAGSMWWA